MASEEASAGQNGGRMRSTFVAAAFVALSLIACNGPREPTPEIGPEDTLTETAEVPEPSPSDTSMTPKSPDNILVETPEYTGVIISGDGASEFTYLFDKASTGFWEPSIADISRAEECISRYIVAVHDDPRLDAYQREDAAFMLENLGDYRRQYVGIVVDGERRIWCNSFLSDDSFPDWERVPVDVDGGGKHFWQIEYDLLKDECLNFYVHGES
jgi:hypothetical protein